MDTPLISVIVPVYKVEDYLDRCVGSIVEQTYRNLEIILVDDGSPDGCGAMCDAWAEKDSRIRVIHKENGGLSDARNAGLAVAEGAYVSFVDSDDWVDVSFLQVLYDVAVQTDAEIAECDFMKTSGNTQRKSGTGQITVCTAEEAMVRHIHVSMFKQVVWNKLYRCDRIRVLFEKGKYHEDEFWTYQIIADCKKLAHIDCTLYFYFQRPDSIMGEGYSSKRIDAVEAKLLRNAFLQERYPQIASMSELDVRFTVIYHGQLALGITQRRDRKNAFEKLKKLYPTNGAVYGANVKITHILWLKLAEINLALCCRIRNLLRIGL